MITFRDRMARGQSRTGWLDSRHSFSFGDYRDPAQMGFRSLRVINEDRVIPGAGFPQHGHRDEVFLVSKVLPQNASRQGTVTTARPASSGSAPIGSISICCIGRAAIRSLRPSKLSRRSRPPARSAAGA